MELNNREQLPGETLNDLGKDIRRLVALAHPRTDKVERDRIAREHFKRAIADPELRKELFRAAPETLDGAIRKAEIVESFSKAENSRRRSRTVAYNRAVETKDLSAKTDIEEIEARVAVTVKDLEKKLRLEMMNARGREQVSMPATSNEAVSQVSYGGDGRGPRNQVHCYACGQVGHIARQCPHKFVNGGQVISAGVGQNEFVAKPPVCYKCNTPGHIARNCGSRRAPICYSCGVEGHISPRCPNNQQGNDVGPPPRPRGRPAEVTKGQGESQQMVAPDTSSTLGQ